ncbi:MAG: hypothetical protein AAF609_01010 [Cyanobacteria bacterium P01_C01_bin.120]
MLLPSQLRQALTTAHRFERRGTADLAFQSCGSLQVALIDADSRSGR